MKARFFYIFKWAVAAALLCLFYGFMIEPRRLVLREVVVDSPRYTGGPQRIVFLSDIHIGGAPITAKRVERIVEEVNAQSPDIILLGGDYVDGHDRRETHNAAFNQEIEAGLKALGGLTAKQGVYAVIGNHDNWYDGAWVAKALSDEGITVLENSVEHKGQLCFVGLADFDTANPSSEPFSDCAKGQFPIVVTHSPDSFRYLANDTVLAVAGHTHGGQINLPLIGRRVTATQAGRPLAYGLKEVGGVPVFITAGIGTSILSARFRAPPELVVLTLRPATQP